VLAWQALAEELTPARSLARLDAAAARVLTSVSVVGTVLTGLGLLRPGGRRGTPPPRGSRWPRW
jgi:hypothetical protein